MTRDQAANGRAAADAPAAKRVRCAIYTRKSTEEGLEQEFNTLNAQRESGEAYVRSLAAEGWVCLPDLYDDGGYTGGNMERPALRKLLADIEAGKVDAVIAYKVDRLSRSLLDFARMMETFERHGVSFVSVTQQFNSANSMGRLTLNVLLSFAQFEREIISERTRDKIAAARRKGRWSGGAPVLGYDVDPVTKRLVVNEAEASRVRAIFALYLERGGLLAVAGELARRGWVTKRWQTRKGHVRGGRPFTKKNLHELLTNVLYRGQVRYKAELHPGLQPALVEESIWKRVQRQLREQGPRTRAEGRPRSHAPLAGLLRCRPCGRAMTPSFATKGTRRYRYYVCTNAQERGWNACPSKSIPADAVERFVIDQLRRAEAERPDLGAVLAEFDAASSASSPARTALLHRLLEQVDYDGATGALTLTLRNSPDAAVPTHDGADTDG